MTRDGDYLWYSDQNFYYIGKTTTGGSQIYNFNPLDNNIRGLAMDGNYIWSINTYGAIKKFSTSGGREKTISDLLSGGWGLTFDGTYLWASDPETDKIYQISLSAETDPPGAPIIASATHPHETIWYSNPDPTFSWEPPDDPSGIAGYSYEFDQTAGTIPDSFIDGSNTTVSYSSVEDGIWYFHCRAQDGADNWSEANHIMIRIDTTPPSNGTILIAEGADTVYYLIVTLNNISAGDEHSGTATMRFSNLGSPWSDEEPFAESRADWNLSQFGGDDPSGVKRVYVSFKDVAGNWSAAPFFDEVVYSAPLQIVTETLNNGTEGFAYVDTLSASGGWPPYEWEITDGTLPHGLNLDTSGIISGEPDSEGDFPFTLRVTDANMNSATRDISITVQSETVKGDVNGDITIDALDLVIVIRYILGMEEFNSQQIWAADIHEDGEINVLDALRIVNIIIGMPTVKSVVSHGQAIISLGETSQFANGERSVHIVLESPVQVAAIQLQIFLPEGSELLSPPQTTPLSQPLTLSHRLLRNHLTLLLYSLSHQTILPDGSLPIVDLKLTGGTVPLRIEGAMIADENGNEIPATIKVENGISQKGWTLHQNYPNPFNPNTDIRYQIPDVGYPIHTTLKVYNLVGQEVRMLVNESKQPGYYTTTWNGRDEAGTLMPSGVYFCKMEVGGMLQTIKMIFTR